jgi:serine/threonine-protein kinase
LKNASGIAVDTAGGVYVADASNNRIVKLPAGGTVQVELPFQGLHAPGGVAVDKDGNVYVTDQNGNRLLKLPAR